MQTDLIPWLLAVVGLACLIAALILRGGRANVDGLGATLRAELAQGQRDAFAQVIAGNAAMQAVVGAFRTEISRQLSEFSGDTRSALEGFGRGQSAQLEAMGGLLRESDARTQASLGTLGETIANRLRVEGDTLREKVGASLAEMRAGNEAKLNEMRAAVDERLQETLSKTVGESFTRVAEQLTGVQQAIGDVKAVAGQVGDLKRLFSNVTTRGGWGEAQVDAMLDEHLPPGSYERNKRLREDSAEMVDFALRIPSRGGAELWLPIDSKFPVADYDRMLVAADAGDREAENAARRGLEMGIRLQAKSIAAKYLVPPRTVEYAVLYLPSDSLFAEIARIPGLIQELRNGNGIVVMGPSLLPAFLHAVRVGHMTLSLERRASEIGQMLGAVRSEWGKLGASLDSLAKRSESVTKGIEETRKRTRAVGRTLRDVDQVEGNEADRLLGLDAPTLALQDEEVV